MAKNEINQLLRDLKVATLLGNPETVNLALNGLLGLPGVASNDRMNLGLIETAILPVGQALTSLTATTLRPLLAHSLAAGRAVGAVALAYLFVDGKHATAKDLRKPANDPRADVRQSLGLALLNAAAASPEKIHQLGTQWLMGKTPKPRHTALIFLPGLAPHYGDKLVGLLGPLGSDDDRDVRAALVEALILLGQAGLAESVLGLLSLWVGEASPNSWVIGRTLSASWAAEHIDQTKIILQTLQSKTKDSSHVSGALKALKRHGVEITLE